MIIKREKVQMIKEKYPVGTRVESVWIDDIHGAIPGTKGTVVHVDDIGTVFVDWDEGKYVKGVVVDGVDEIKIIG